MTPQALTALKQSIEHWRRLTAGTPNPGELIGRSWCALCREFNDLLADELDCCVGCPVYANTGFKYCAKTPWEAIEEKLCLHNYRLTDWIKTPQARALAAEELAFLESLLPEDRK